MTEPDQGTTESVEQLQTRLIEELKRFGALTDSAVEAAFRAVPRHLFLPDVPIAQAYQNEAIPTKKQHGRAISSSSQPSIMAVMLEQLGLVPGMRVLEIGAGTGYNAAMLAHLVGPGGRVVSIDIDDDIVQSARAHLQIAGYGHVQVECRDGAIGFPEAAPFDRIILTVGAWDVLPAWLAQLQPQGRLVVPLTLVPHVMFAVAFEQIEQVWQSVHVAFCGFMPLRGAFAHPVLGTPSIMLLPKGEQQELASAYSIRVDKAWNQLVVTWPIQLEANGE